MIKVKELDHKMVKFQKDSKDAAHKVPYRLLFFRDMFIELQWNYIVFHHMAFSPNWLSNDLAWLGINPWLEWSFPLL
jgi:hypothetical protein